MSSIVLTPEQEEVVAAENGAFLVVAPPGSGKTEIIGQRIVRLLRGHERESFKILALTFTKRAAAEMMARVEAGLGDESWRATITTYHSFCLDVLRHYGAEVGVQPNVTVYDSDDDRLEALLQGLEEGGYLSGGGQLDRSELLSILGTISRLKRDLIPSAAAKDVQVVGLVTERQAYEAYEAALNRNGAIDYEGILSRTYQLFAENVRVAKHYRRMYRYILIDEGQDTNAAQYQILRALCGEEHRNVLMVADPAQSIYSFRGAGSQFINMFVSDFGARTLQLAVNFRCSRAVLRVAYGLIPRRPTEGPPSDASLDLEPAVPGHVEAYSYSDEQAEGTATLEWARRLLSHGMKDEWLAFGEEPMLRPEQIAVLARNRFQLGGVLEAFRSGGVDHYFATGDLGPFDSELYRAILYGLRVLANPRDLAIRKSLVAQIPAQSAEPGTSLTTLKVHEMFTQLARLTVDPHRSWLELLATAAASPSLTLMDRLSAWSPPTVDVEDDMVELWRSDRELLSARWASYRNRVAGSDRSWTGLVLQIVDQPRADRAGIRILTIHAAKGLEFNAVALVGLNDGSLPDFRSRNNEADYASEKRIAYVAVTRAARVLRLSRPRSRQTRYGPRTQDESPFVKDMGIRLISV